MRDENKKHYEKKNAEMKELTDDISNLIRSVESGAGINGSGVNGGVQRQERYAQNSIDIFCLEVLFIF